MPHTILLVDDEPKLRDVVGVALGDLGYRVLAASSGAEALKVLEEDSVDLVLSDLRMAGMDGRQLLLEIKSRNAQMPVIIVTAYSSLRDAVELVKQGAFDYIGKPFEIDELVATIGNALKLSSALADNRRLRAQLEGRYHFDSLVGESAAFRKVIGLIGEVCESRASVLLTGESGTGKEMAARAIHFNSPRKAGPFVALNCAAIPEGLLESELFGHVKGAFTGAMANRTGRFLEADRGTLFLDEIGDMPLATQAKILRVLQDRTVVPVGGGRPVQVDVRILSATNKDLMTAVREKTFREDLYYRLNVFPIVLPPLRERREDVPLLAAHFGARLAEEMGRRFTGFTPAALAAMIAYAWPGNIRELQNCVERALIVSHERTIDVADLPGYLFERAASGAGPGDALPEDLDAALEAAERRWIVEALRRSGGVQVRAAELLGIQERSLWHRIKKYNIAITRDPH